MPKPDNVKHCPACGARDVALAADRYGVKTFYCADCEYDWDEQEGRSTTPDSPEQPQQ
jgi:transposase-like protein